jgi:hypothetical protein
MIKVEKTEERGVHRLLGISEERHDEMASQIVEILKVFGQEIIETGAHITERDTVDSSDIFKRLADIPKTNEELFLIGYLMGIKWEDVKHIVSVAAATHKNPLMGALAMMKDIAENKGDNDLL